MPDPSIRADRCRQADEIRPQRHFAGGVADPERIPDEEPLPDVEQREIRPQPSSNAEVDWMDAIHDEFDGAVRCQGKRQENLPKLLAGRCGGNRRNDER